MADAADSKSAAREGVRVRVPLSALVDKSLEPGSITKVLRIFIIVPFFISKNYP